MKYLIIILFVGLIFFGCEKPPSYSNIPIIQFKSISTNFVRDYSDDSADAQYLPDTLQVQITFTDGNGAIGEPIGDTTGGTDGFAIDSRLSPNGQRDTNYFSIPYITPAGNIKAISGTISFTMYSMSVRPLPAYDTGDTLHYTIFIKDRNGNYSNSVQTPTIYIKNN